MSAGGGCEAAVIGRTTLWVKLRECGELLHGRRFLLGQKGAVCKSYVRTEIVYESETWCLKESDMVLF